MTIKMRTKDKVRFVMPEIIVIDGKMYKPSVGPMFDGDCPPQLFLDEIISEDEEVKDGSRIGP